MHVEHRLFKLAGYSTDPLGLRKARVANDFRRVFTLARVGHDDVTMWAMPTPMTRQQAIDWLAAGKQEGCEFQHSDKLVPVDFWEESDLDFDLIDFVDDSSGEFQFRLFK